MKKVLAWLIVIFVGLSAQAYAATVSIPDSDANPGAVIEIPIMVDNAARVTGFQFTVAYDASVLEAVGAGAGELTAGWMVTPNTNAAGQLKVAGVSTTLQALRSGSAGSIAKLQFKVIGKPGKKNDLSFSVCSLADSEGKKIAATCKGGQIKIKGPKKDK